MDINTIIIQIGVPFVAGGGLMWLFHFRRMARRKGNELRKEEFDTVSEVVERATQQVAALAEKIALIESARAELKTQVIELLEENKRLDRECKNLEAALKRYMKT